MELGQKSYGASTLASAELQYETRVHAIERQDGQGHF
jgi:hypothetical protein